MHRLTSLVLAASLIGPATAHADDEYPPLSIYGFARLDIFADDARISDLNGPSYVMRESGTHHADGQLTMTPRQSRIGLAVDPWKIASHLVGEGRLEVDFAGGSGTNAIRLRQAYATIAFDRVAELVAGQATDLISPLFPSAQSDTQLVFAGNTGDRRPQLQLALTFDDWLRVGLGVAQSGALSRADADSDGRIDGSAQLRPMLQWLAELRVRMRNDDLRVGVWGHLQRSELADGTQYTGASVGLHVYLPITRDMVWLGEAYTGTNLADIGGGIGQGYNVMTGTVHGAGGWFEIATLPSQRHVVALGTSIDTARASDLAIGDRARNQTFYAAVRYKPRTALQLGAEYVYWRTRFHDVGDARDATANRVDLHLSVMF